MLAEISLTMQSTPVCFNPISLCCWSDEDHIGRISKVSRATHGNGLACSLDTIRRSLGMYRMQLQRFRP